MLSALAPLGVCTTSADAGQHPCSPPPRRTPGSTPALHHLSRRWAAPLLSTTPAKLWQSQPTPDTAKQLPGATRRQHRQEPAETCDRGSSAGTTSKQVTQATCHVPPDPAILCPGIPPQAGAHLVTGTRMLTAALRVKVGSRKELNQYPLTRATNRTNGTGKC